MSTVKEEEFKRRTAKRKAVLVTKISVHWHRFETLQHSSRIIGNRMGFYIIWRPYPALSMKTPATAFALAA